MTTADIYLLILKSIAAATALYLGVSAIFIDFKEAKNKGKKTLYIVVFSFSVVLGFFLDYYKGEQDKKASDQQFSDVISNNKKLLSRTSDQLNGQFGNLNKINNSIDTKLNGVSKSEKSLTQLTGTIHKISGNIDVNLGHAIDTLRKLDTGQKKTLVEIKRNLYSLNNIQLSYSIAWDFRNKELIDYSERLKTYINAAKKTAVFTHLIGPGGDKEFAYFDNGNISATFSSPDLQLQDLIISNESSMLPSCKENNEVSICQNVLFDALYFHFTDNSNGIYYESYAYNDSNECGKNNSAHRITIPAGSSAVDLNLHFDNSGNLSAFECDYQTNRIKSITSKGIISQMELLGSTLQIQRFDLGNFRVEGFHHFIMYFNGSLEGIRIADIENEYAKTMVIDHSVIKGDFLFDIFKN